ncbi:MAG: lactate racemase domain-containing protein, partial [Myxococcota bacterium]
MTESRAQVEEAILATFETSHYADASVVVAVPDATRDVDFGLILPPLFEQLQRVGAEVRVWVALGLHRPMSEEELRPLAAVCDRYDVPIRQHDPSADDILTLSDDVSEELEGWPRLPACYPASLAEADRLICVGSVEPHQYAGFSGGIKTVSIGCAGKETIDAMHGLEFLRMKGTTVGRVQDNSFQAALWKLAAALPPADALMFVPSDFAPWHDVYFGRASVCFATCRDIAEQVFFRLYREPQDWLHLPVTGAKSVNFYQASRAATYAALVHEPAIREGGLLVLEAECSEGVGRGTGERACAAAMERGVDELMAELHGDVPGASTGGQQRAFVLARALQHCDICLVGAPEMAAVAAMGIRQFESVEAAL